MNIENKEQLKATHLKNHSTTYISGEKYNTILLLSLLISFLIVPLFFLFCFLPLMQWIEMNINIGGSNGWAIIFGLLLALSVSSIVKISIFLVEAIYMFKEPKKCINNMSQFYQFISQEDIVSKELLNILNEYIKEGKVNPILWNKYYKKHCIFEEYINFHNFIIKMPD